MDKGIFRGLWPCSTLKLTGFWYGPQEIPWAGTHKGHQDMLKFFGAIGATVSVEAYEPREFLPGENGLVTVLGWQRVRVKATHKAWETNWRMSGRFRTVWWFAPGNFMTPCRCWWPSSKTIERNKLGTI